MHTALMLHTGCYQYVLPFSMSHLFSVIIIHIGLDLDMVFSC